MEALAVRRAVRGLRRARLAFAVRLHGIEAANERLLRQTRGVDRTLRQCGATVGEGGTICGPLVIHNADPDYRNLKIGWRAHIGRYVRLDLTAPVIVGNEATVSMGCTILTHADVGDRPLSALFPRKVSETRIGRGAYLGADVTVLCGCHIGEGALVAAGATVTEPIPGGVLAVGTPARVVRELHADELEMAFTECDPRYRGE